MSSNALVQLWGFNEAKHTKAAFQPPSVSQTFRAQARIIIGLEGLVRRQEEPAQCDLTAQMFQ